MRIPEIRDRLLGEAQSLYAMASELDDQAESLRNMASALEFYVKEMHRRVTPRASQTSERMTPKLKREIKAYVRAHPREPLAKVGARFNVNIGRISTIKNGERK